MTELTAGFFRSPGTSTGGQRTILRVGGNVVCNDGSVGSRGIGHAVCVALLVSKDCPPGQNGGVAKVFCTTAFGV